jgi:7-carboxy-7-deazaguanine synthase (Cx14CxxC type)
MTYAVKEMFLTLQGEGAQTGRAAVFLRFAGCNLWSGREQDRADATCTFCDTDFVGTDGENGAKFETAEALVSRVAAIWNGGPGPSFETRPSDAPQDERLHVGTHPEEPAQAGVSKDGHTRYIVCTGGEPLLQLDAPLIAALKRHGFTIAIETNGTIAAPPGIDWICVSPKADAKLVQISGDELKLVYPQSAALPERFENLSFRHFFLQPMDGPAREENTHAAIRYCLAHPQWRLSLQTHKLIGIP